METPVAPQGTPIAIQILDESLGGGNGGSRRPGNVWTEQAREDVFNRREAGEGWETICPDYPNRSRHAMQQQYSMMKKQRAVAEGTWVSNRRGRKRKNTSGERWASVNKQKPDWEEPEDDEDTQDEDFEDPGLEHLEEDEDKEMNYPQSDQVDDYRAFRPPLPVRSATDPIFRPQRSKIVTFPNLPNSAGYQHATHPMWQDGLDSSRTNIENEGSEYTTNQVTYPNKRLKHSPNIGGKSEASDPSSAAVVSFSDLMLDEDEILGLLERARQKAHMMSMNYETEKSSQRQIFEEAVSRANRRAYDYEERLRDSSYEHADAMKFIQRQHTDELQTRKREFEREQKKRSDLFIQKTDALNRVIQNLQKQRDDKDKAHAEEIAALRDELQEAIRKQSAVPSEANSATVTLRQLSEQLFIKEEHLKVSQQTAIQIFQKIQHLREFKNAMQEPILQTKSMYLGLTRTLDKLNRDLEDLSMKAIGKAVGKLLSDTTQAEEWLLKATKSLDITFKAFDTLPTELPIEFSLDFNGSGEQEMHETKVLPNVYDRNGDYIPKPINGTASTGDPEPPNGSNGTSGHDHSAPVIES